MNSPTILVTGANGFVGQHFLKFLQSKNCQYFTLHRGPSLPSIQGVTLEHLPSITIDTVVHLAGRAHVLKELAADPMAEFKAANVDFTLAVASAAVSAGAKRFVFISSVGVYGIISTDSPITEFQTPNPQELYAHSKLEAEQRLRAYLSEQGVELVVLRPALIYGDNAPGNLAKLFKLCDSSMPLPFRNANAQRTMLNVQNFCEAIWLSAMKAEAVGQIYNVADRTGVSTSELVSCFKQRLARRDLQFSLPKEVLKRLLGLAKKEKMYQQLFGAFDLDSTKLMRELGWSPELNPISVLKTINMKK